MRLAVLGAGAMGGAVARLLARHPAEIVVIDSDRERAERAAAACGGGAHVAGIGSDGLVDALRGAAAVAACLPYRLNLDAMEAALAAGCSYADLGGMFHMTHRQLELDARFREAGLSAVLGIGAAPGMTNVLASAAAARLDRVTSIDLITGSRSGSDGFAVPYSAETILDEFTLPAQVFENGALREVPAGSGAVTHRFPEPVGEVEAVYTLHSEPATLPRTIPGVKDVRWRLGLPPSVARGFRFLVELGLSSDEPILTPDGPVRPRALLLALLERRPPAPASGRDAEYVEARVAGERDGREGTVVARAFFGAPPEEIDAGAFATGLPIAMTLRWLAEGRTPAGVHPPETAFEPDDFLADVAGEGVAIELLEE